jgi:outer membrane protein assembly factor BamB
MHKTTSFAALLHMITMVTMVGVAVPHADDWPEFRGEGRLGIWHETGILDTFPEDGLAVRWRTPIHHGFAGPSVADGRVFVTDFERTQGLDGIERILCLDEDTGEILWTQSWAASYAGVSWDEGPRATPTVDGDQVYAVGASGILTALRVENGDVLWRTHFVDDYGADVPSWGFSSAPLVDGDRVITLVGGQPDAKVVAFDRTTGAEVWRALSSVESGPGVGQPFLTDAGGVRQLIIWHPLAVSSLNPATGETYWEEPFEVGWDMTVATPIRRGSDLFVSTFYDGPMMIGLDNDRPAAELRWRGSSNSEILTDGLHAVIGTPIIQGSYIYGFGSYGQLRCLVAATGERVWETQEATGERARWTSAFIVQHEDRVFINNDRGDLIIAKLSPEGYEEISRTPLLKPTSRPGNRRELQYVSWSHPAYANQHIYARNDEEIISASLKAPE